MPNDGSLAIPKQLAITPRPSEGKISPNASRRGSLETKTFGLTEFPTLTTARAGALSAVQLLLRHPDQLAAVPRLLEEFRLKKGDSQEALSTALRHQIDEIRIGKQTLAWGSNELVKIGETNAGINEKCQECKELFVDYPSIKQAAVARRNMDVTTSLLNHFRAIPRRVEELRERLDKDDRSVKAIYQEFRQLVQLRDTASSQSATFTKNFEEQIASSFKALQDFAEELETRIWENIEECSYLVSDDPAVLIRTIEVIEMEDKARRKVLSGLQEAKVPGKAKPTQSMKDRMFDKLRYVIHLSFESLMKSEEEVKAERAAAGKKEEPTRRSYVVGVFEELKSLMADRELLAKSLTPLFPPSYKIAEFYAAEYSNWSRKVIARHTSESESLSKDQILNIVNFLQWYERDQKCIGNFVRTIEELMQVYVKNARETINNMINNIITMEEESQPVKTSEGHFITLGPADLFSTINQQLDICFAQLRGPHVEFLVLMLGDLLTEYQNRQTEFLNEMERGEGNQLLFGARKLVKDHTYLCALINNSSQCQTNLDDVKARCLEACSVKDKDEDEDEDHLDKTLSKIEDYLDETAEGFVNVKTQAVDILGMLLMESLEEPISQLFGPGWLTEKFSEVEAVTDKIIALLVEHFDQYSVFLATEPPFLRIVKTALRQLTTEYLRRFCEVKPALTEQTTKQLHKDTDAFAKFFGEYVDGVIISAKGLEEEIHILQLIETVMNADPTFISMHFVTITNRFKRGAMVVMRGLLAVRDDLTKKEKDDIIKSFNAQLAPEFREDFKEPDVNNPHGVRLGKDGKGGFWSKFKVKKSAPKEKPSEKRKQEQENTGTGSSVRLAVPAPKPEKPEKPEKPDDAESVDLADFLA